MKIKGSEKDDTLSVKEKGVKEKGVKRTILLHYPVVQKVSSLSLPFYSVHVGLVPAVDELASVLYVEAPGLQVGGTAALQVVDGT